MEDVPLLALVRAVSLGLCLVDSEISSDDDGCVQRYGNYCNDLGEILMWSSRSRNRDDDERYRERTTDRLRGVGATKRVDDDAEQVRARLERMNYGASRKQRPGESPA